MSEEISVSVIYHLSQQRTVNVICIATSLVNWTWIHLTKAVYYVNT